MGAVLGLLGGGGSILTLPILVYIFSVAEEIAPSYSLFVVGVAAVVGTLGYIRTNNISLKTGLVFGAPAMLAVYLTQRYLVPALPDVFFTFGSTDFTQGMGLMVLFAIMMLLASWSMIRKKKKKPATEVGESKLGSHWHFVLLEGLGLGLFTGLVGAGGGFMIVPVLVVLSGLPMKTAVGTSLFIIAAKSLLGFFGAVQADVYIDWEMLLPFTGLAVVGIVLGMMLASRIPGAKLKPIFGWFVLIMGIFVITKTFLDA